MKISFAPLSDEHVPLCREWAKKDFIKDTWFQEGYQSVDYIFTKTKNNGHDYPFIIYLDDKPVGYIQYCDLYAYKKICPNPTGVFIDEPQGTFCMDLFIGEEDYLNKGYGTKIVTAMINELFSRDDVTRIVIDPSPDNVRALRCYEKAGFKFLRRAHDGVNECVVLEIVR